MSFAEKAIVEKCNELGQRNEALEVQNERLSCLLAESLNILDRFKRDAEDTLRHFNLDRKLSGKFDPKKLRSG